MHKILKEIELLPSNLARQNSIRIAFIFKTTERLSDIQELKYITSLCPY